MRVGREKFDKRHECGVPKPCVILTKIESPRCPFSFEKSEGLKGFGLGCFGAGGSYSMYVAYVPGLFVRVIRGLSYAIINQGPER